VANLPKKIILFYFIILIFFIFLVIFEGGREGMVVIRRSGCGLLGSHLWPQQWSRSFLVYTVIEWCENFFFILS